MKLSIKLKNAFHPGYSACKKCGGNWGWKEGADHMTSKSRWLFLFCKECDKIVTIEERWEALDEWKRNALNGPILFADAPLEKVKEEINNILNREFLEFPREKKEEK